jgi:hypothetical protein
MLAVVAGHVLWVALMAESDSAPSGRGAEAHIRRALAAEARREPGERDRQLALALEADPANARARALLGQVADGEGRWASPEEIGRRAREDARRAERLAEYNDRRARAPRTVAGQWALANWCEENGLAAEAIAHYTAVTRLNPEHAAAWGRLGFRKYRGRWMTPAQIAAERVEIETQATADAEWRPRLATWRRWLREEATRPEAERALEQVRDPRAVPSIWRVFAQSSARDQNWAVALLGRIDAPKASHGLALLAALGESARVRDAATDRLTSRDPRGFLGLLINLLRDPILYEAIRPRGPGSPGLLLMEGPTSIRERIYDPLPAPSGPEPSYFGGYTLDSSGRWRRFIRTEQAETGFALDEERRSIEATDRQMAEDIATLDQINARVEQVDAHVERALVRLTGMDLGRDRESWAAWWTDQLGYTYTSPQLLPKPVVVQAAAPAYVPRPPPVVTTTTVLRSCFGAGTPVHTGDGLRPIEDIQVGDLVLSRDTSTGALGFEPVVQVFHNPPAATVRLELGGTTIVATGIHRFWRPGLGWAMARDLKPGDTLRTLRGLARVVAVEPDEIQPIYNLEVARTRTFLVGRLGLLVHDNSFVEPTPRPFDAGAEDGETGSR